MTMASGQPEHSGFDRRSLDDYIEVHERMAEFYAKFPDGSLSNGDWRIVQAEGWDKGGTQVMQTFIVYRAEAYRTPDDPRPGVGVAWEVFPGRTPYTRGSEIMNAETSAWGRALAALGIATKRGIASRQEVAARRAERDEIPPAYGGWPEDEKQAHMALRRGEMGKLSPADKRAKARADQQEEFVPVKPDAVVTPLPITKAQSSEYHAKFKQLFAASALYDKLSPDDAKKLRLEMTSQVVGRPVASSTELSRVEAARVIAALDAKLEAR